MNKKQIQGDLKRRAFSEGFTDGLMGIPDDGGYSDNRALRKVWRRGYYEGIQKRFANLGLALVTPKRADEDTSRFHAWIVRVFWRDNAYWIVPVARGEAGCAYSPTMFLPMSVAIPLTLGNAGLNATRLDDDESRRVVAEVNKRYDLRLVYAPDARIVKGEAVHA